MAEKKERWPKHIDGDGYGGDLYEDGSIRIAPALYEQMDSLITQAEGIDHVLKTVVAHCSEMQRIVAHNKSELFNRIGKNYGIDWSVKSGRYDPHHKKIITTDLPPKEEKK